MIKATHIKKTVLVRIGKENEGKEELKQERKTG